MSSSKEICLTHESFTNWKGSQHPLLFTSHLQLKTYKDFTPFPALARQEDTPLHHTLEALKGACFSCILTEDAHRRWDIAHFILKHNLEARASTFFSQATCKATGDSGSGQKLIRLRRQAPS